MWDAVQPVNVTALIDETIDAVSAVYEEILQEERREAALRAALHLSRIAADRGLNGHDIWLIANDEGMYAAIDADDDGTD